MATVTAADHEQHLTYIKTYPNEERILRSTTLFEAFMDLRLDHVLITAFRPTVQENLETCLHTLIQAEDTVVKLDSKDGTRHATVTIRAAAQVAAAQVAAAQVAAAQVAAAP